MDILWVVLRTVQRALRYGLIGAMALMSLNTAAYLLSAAGGEKFLGWVGAKVHDDKIAFYVQTQARPLAVRLVGCLADQDDSIWTIPELMAMVPATAADEPSVGAAVAEEVLSPPPMPPDERRIVLTNSWNNLGSDVQGLWVVGALLAAGLAAGLGVWWLGLMLWPEHYAAWLIGAAVSVAAAGAAVVLHLAPILAIALALMALLLFHGVVQLLLRALVGLFGSREIARLIVAAVFVLIPLAVLYLRASPTAWWMLHTSLDLKALAAAAQADPKGDEAYEYWKYAQLLKGVRYVAGFLFGSTVLGLLLSIPLRRRKLSRPVGGTGPNLPPAQGRSVRPAPTAGPEPFALPAVFPLAVAVIGSFFHGYVLGLVAALLTGYVRRHRWLNAVTIPIALCTVIVWTYGVELWFGPGWSKTYWWGKLLYWLDSVGGR